MLDDGLYAAMRIYEGSMCAYSGLVTYTPELFNRYLIISAMFAMYGTTRIALKNQAHAACPVCVAPAALGPPFGCIACMNPAAFLAISDAFVMSSSCTCFCC